MKSPEFITLTLHTHERAITLKKILENHDIEVKLENLHKEDIPLATGVRVLIKESDVVHAIKVMESAEPIYSANLNLMMAGTDGNILIPVDFKPYSLKACKLGFELAQRLSLHPVILHAYAGPIFTNPMSVDNIFSGFGDPTIEEEFTEIEIGKDLRKESKLKMLDFRKIVEKEQKEKRLPDIRFTTMVNEGVAEDVIKEYCRMTPPVLIVMATREKQKKGEELIGSVTAEVLDSCKVPVFSIPENGHFEKVENIKKIVFFCNLDRQDIVTVDSLMRMFDFPQVNVTLIPINEKPVKDVKVKIDILKDYFNKAYPEAHFTSQVFPVKTFLADFNNYEMQAGIEMLIVPNKKRNIFTRILNPGIAHKLLFERDLPLLALPS